MGRQRSLTFPAGRFSTCAGTAGRDRRRRSPCLAGRSVGVHRLLRDAGFAVGALLAGIVADLVSMEAAIYAVATLTALSGFVVIVRMYETHPPAPTGGD